MWIASKLGFYSIVQKQPGEWHVRARTKRDLEKLVKMFWVERLADIECWPAADYRWRIILRDRAEVRELFGVLADSVDYPNFKGVIGTLPDQREKLPAYHDLWHGLMRLQR